MHGRPGLRLGPRWRAYTYSTPPYLEALLLKGREGVMGRKGRGRVPPTFGEKVTPWLLN